MNASPSFDEMRQALNLKSKSGIFALLKALEERGFIKRLGNRARAIELVKFPPDQGDNVKTESLREVASIHTLKIPLYGEIAAGMPIEAFENKDQTVEVSENLLPGGIQMAHNYFALRIVGDSMKDAGILDQDIVILERCMDAPPGAIVAVLVDEDEITLKRWCPEGKTVTLMPANQDHIPQTYDPERLRIMGRLVHLVRKYF